MVRDAVVWRRSKVDKLGSTWEFVYALLVSSDVSHHATPRTSRVRCLF